MMIRYGSDFIHQRWHTRTYVDRNKKLTLTYGHCVWIYELNMTCSHPHMHVCFTYIYNNRAQGLVCRDWNDNIMRNKFIVNNMKTVPWCSCNAAVCYLQCAPFRSIQTNFTAVPVLISLEARKSDCFKDLPTTARAVIVICRIFLSFSLFTDKLLEKFCNVIIIAFLTR